MIFSHYAEEFANMVESGAFVLDAGSGRNLMLFYKRGLDAVGSTSTAKV